MLRRAGICLVAAVAVVAGIAGSAAAGIGPLDYSAAQTGYAVTGGLFSTVESNVKLPDPGRFAGQIGRLGLSVQLWTATQVFDLAATACTDASCVPGGRPQDNSYRLVFAVFNRSTGAVICSTAMNTCPSVPRSWDRARLAPGKTASLSLSYDHTDGFLNAQINNQAYINDNPPAGLRFSQARIAAQFGTSPLSEAAFHPPASQIPLASFGVPPGPPFEAEIATYNGHAGCLVSWWARHRVELTSSGTSATPVHARPHSLSGQGCDFTLYLQP